MAALRLQHEALQQKRDAVVALARHVARNAVRRQLQAQGVKVALVPLSLISAQANVYLLAHSAKLFAQARATAERWAAQSVRKDQRNRTLALQAQRNQKGISAMSELTPIAANRTPTDPAAERGLSAARISNI